jgi:TldD protein
MRSRVVRLCVSGLSGAVGFSFLVSALAGDEVSKPRVHESSVSPAPIMGLLSGELAYSMENLVSEDGSKPYYLAYTVYDEGTSVVAATLGAVTRNQTSRGRKLTIDLRVGDYKLDNTHQIRGGGRSQASGSGNISLAIDDNADSIRHTLWYYTDKNFRRAAKRLTQVMTDLKVKVEEEDKSDDFSRETAHVYYEAPATSGIDLNLWTDRLRRVSAIAREYPLVYNSSVTLGVHVGTRYLVNSEGGRLQTSETRYRITMSASTKAEDGMDLQQSDDFNAALADGLPGEDEVANAFRKVLDQVLALREAPLAEPYIGPAILRNRASGVFFHEIFGHRIEGHRQKDVTEGQTFTKKVNEAVLPPFISIVSDPTRRRFGDIDLRGFYRFDDEGVVAQKFPLVDKGVLKTFLMSRTPVENVPASNGHGRRQPGKAVVSRQSNLIVESSKQVPFEKLRALLIDECKKQDKPYGLLFEDISGGFTTTSRRGPQSFKVLPIIVYKIFADGKPDELIRGADIVGTPLTCFEKIINTGDDPDVFNGTCGAESGWVPVSAISPSILVSTIEIEKRTRAQSRPPILPPPFDDVKQAAGGQGQ